MSFKNIVAPAEMESFDSSTMTGTYQALNTGVDRAVLILKIVNDSTQNITISWDGTTDHDYIPSHTALVLDLQANNIDPNNKYLVKSGQVFYAKGTAGTGNIYVIGYGREAR